MKFSPPSLPPNIKSSAEKSLFEVLQKMVGWDDWTCFHSLRLDKHSYQTCGEIDFLLLGPDGVLAIEVKGGRVSVQDGEFSHANRFGRVTRDPRGPYRQVEDAVYSLWHDLEQRSSVRDFLQFVNHGWIVSFPDIQFDLSSVEHDPVLTIDVDNCRNQETLSKSLQNALGYWKHKKKRFRPLIANEIDLLARLLRPSFDKVPSLRHQSADHKAVSVDMTERQYAIIDAVRDNPRITCSGGAGTGKSFIALEAARRNRDEGMLVLFTSQNINLLSFLRQQPDLDGIIFQPWDAADGTFDYVVLDEAQDCITENTLSRLEVLTGTEWNNGRWLLCLDPNGQANVGGQLHYETFELLKLQSVNLNLSVNCRNTGIILSQTKWATGADVGVTGTGNGPSVSWCPVSDAESEASALSLHLEYLVGHEGLNISDITLLDMGDGLATLRNLSTSWRNKIYPLTQHIVDNWSTRSITFSRIADFKGLENTAICIIGARGIANLTAPVNYLYVAMTRALSHLWVGTTKELGNLIESENLGNTDVNGQRRNS